MALSSEPEEFESTVRASDGRPMKQCPKCGEEILAVAIRCRYCKSPVADTSRAPGGSEFLVWRDGPLLVMDKQSRLPERCVKSNEPTDGFTLKRRLSWHPQFVYLLLLAGLLLYVLVAVCMQKTATIHIGLSHEWAARRRRRILIAWLVALGGLATMFVGIGMASDLTPWFVVGGIATALIAAISGLLSSRLVSPARITESHVWLKGVHPDYLAMLPEWPGE